MDRGSIFNGEKWTGGVHLTQGGPFSTAKSGSGGPFSTVENGPGGTFLGGSIFNITPVQAFYRIVPFSERRFAPYNAWCVLYNYIYIYIYIYLLFDLS